MCPGRFAALQEIGEDPLAYCPTCGLSVRRVVSSVNISLEGKTDGDKAARRGFTTFKRTGEGQWEKVSGPGVDAIVASDEDKAAVKAEKKKRKPIDL